MASHTANFLATVFAMGPDPERSERESKTYGQEMLKSVLSPAHTWKSGGAEAMSCRVLGGAEAVYGTDYRVHWNSKAQQSIAVRSNGPQRNCILTLYQYVNNTTQHATQARQQEEFIHYHRKNRVNAPPSPQGSRALQTVACFVSPRLQSRE